ncbi:MAG: signal recognition particle protein [Planctomycetaceae bacterium]|jgi:signal recognition particle subunit SRP54|nr:signal recognition particle protein [Planctomycetaceae bacterium]
MFENLTERLSTAFRNLSGRGTISESNVQEALGEIQTALLEADVELGIAKQFCADVMEKARGREVTKSLKPGQELVGIVHDELVALMAPSGGDAAGEQASRIFLVDPGPTVIMMCGLQGSGKTTTCGKLAAYFKKMGRSCLVAAADLQRPAAVEQLQQVIDGVAANAKGSSRIAFYGEPDKCAEYGKAVNAAVGVCRRAVDKGRAERFDVVILDTAGRLHVNDELMKELEGVRMAVNPHQIFLVVDAMTGQDAVRSAKAFHERLSVDGVILTKLDSDTRGGAALTVRKVTGAPIKFLGTGEKFDALDEFSPKRMAGRILGMGDVVALVEKAREEVSEEEAEKMAEKLAKGKLTMDDFLSQMKSLRRMGPMKQLLGLLPGVGSALKDINIDDKQFDRLEGMVHSMTAGERRDLKLFNKGRVRRIATGSGTTPNEVNRLVTQFETVQKMTASLASGGMADRIKAAKAMSQSGGMPGLPGMPGFPGMSMKGSSATQSIKAKFKQRKK